ncbi:MFS transporter [Metabacillus niabensis]|uniref:MFS transporter n=1 Tax=Metabacillus niabensis TaxID=324854 RepID=UPI0039A062A6
MNILNKMNMFKAYPKDALVFILASFINSSGKALMWPLITLYVSSELGKSYGEAGMVILLQSLFGIFGEIIGGMLYYRLGPRKLIVGSTLASGIAILSIVFIENWYLYIVMMCALGMMNGITMPGVHSYIGFRWKEFRKRLFNIVYVCNNLGLAFGAAAGGLLAAISFQLTYVVTGVITIIFACFLFTFMESEAEETKQVNTGKILRHDAPITLLKDYKVYLFLSIGASFYWITFNFWGTGVGPYLVEQGYEISLYSFLWTINGIVILAGQPILIFLKRTIAKSINAQLITAAIFCTLGYTFLLLFHDHYNFFLLGMIVCTLGEMLILPAIPLYFSETTGRDAPFYLGVSGGFANIGRMFGPLIIGNLYDFFGIVSVLVCISGVSILTIIFFSLHAINYKSRTLSRNERKYLEMY